MIVDPPEAVGWLDAYFITTKGTCLNKDTYWIIKKEGQEPWYIRFIQIEDTAGGLSAVVQDESGYANMTPCFFDLSYVSELKDPDEIALAMLAIHS